MLNLCVNSTISKAVRSRCFSFSEYAKKDTMCNLVFTKSQIYLPTIKDSNILSVPSNQHILYTHIHHYRFFSSQGRLQRATAFQHLRKEERNEDQSTGRLCIDLRVKKSEGAFVRGKKYQICILGRAVAVSSARMWKFRKKKLIYCWMQTLRSYVLRFYILMARQRHFISEIACAKHDSNFHDINEICNLIFLSLC